MATLVSFRIRHTTLDLAELAKAIDLPIARIWKSGADRRTPNGDPLDGVFNESYAAFRVETPDGTISAAIGVVDAALRKASDLQPTTTLAALEMSLYCTLLADGETIDCKSLEGLVSWGIRLEIAGCPAP